MHGHRHPAIDAAIRAQLDRSAHSTLLGLSHGPAIIRPLGNVIVLMPAPAMSYEDLRRLVAIMAASIDEATAARVLSAA